METIISLTSVPSRFDYLEETLLSLLKQSYPVDKINVYLPKYYKRFDYHLKKIPTVPKGVNVKITKKDFGPATKLLPALKENWNKKTRIIFCDDDRVYDESMVSRLITESIVKPDCIIAEEGRDIKDISDFNWQGSDLPRATLINKNFLYRWYRLLSLGGWKPRKNASSGYVDTLAGFGGVMVLPHYFTNQIFDVPEVAWMVDDIWISGQLALNKKKIWVTNSSVKSKTSRGSKLDALGDVQDENSARRNANNAAIKYFRDTHKIWNDKK